MAENLTVDNYVCENHVCGILLLLRSVKNIVWQYFPFKAWNFWAGITPFDNAVLFQQSKFKPLHIAAWLLQSNKMCKIRGYQSFEVVKKQALLIVVKVDLRFTTIAKL